MPTKTADLNKGDVIMVIRIHQFGPDQHIPAVVKTVSRDAFGVQALRGDFDNGGGHDLLWLEKSAKGRTWL